MAPVLGVLKTFPNSTKFLKTIVSFGTVPAEQREEVKKFGLAIYSWDEFLLLGGSQQFDLPKNEKIDICTILYTSGTTGDPKGVMISNQSIITLIAGVDRLLDCMNEQVCRVRFLLEVSWGTLFNIAYKYKLHNMIKGSKHEEAASIFDKIVFNKVKAGLGGNVRLILSGAVPLATHVEEFLRVVSCAHVLQGYGLTQSCGGTFVSLPNNLSVLGTDVPKMNYDALSREIHYSQDTTKERTSRMRF